MESSVSVIIDRPVDEVFDYLADPGHMTEWLPGASVRRRVSEGPLGVGTRYEAIDRILGRDISSLEEVVAYERGRRVVFRVSAPFDASHDLRFEPVDGGTRVTETFHMRPSGFLGIFRFLPTVLVRRQIESDYERLKAVLEGQHDETA